MRQSTAVTVEWAEKRQCECVTKELCADYSKQCGYLRFALYFDAISWKIVHITDKKMQTCANARQFYDLQVNGVAIAIGCETAKSNSYWLDRSVSRRWMPWLTNAHTLGNVAVLGYYHCHQSSAVRCYWAEIRPNIPLIVCPLHQIKAERLYWHRNILYGYIACFPDSGRGGDGNVDKRVVSEAEEKQLNPCKKNGQLRLKRS